MLFAYGRGASRVSFREARAAIREKQGSGLVTISSRRRFVTKDSGSSDIQPWRIAAAGAAGVAFALGWGSGYIGGHSGADAPVSAPARMVHPNEASAAPTDGDAPKPPVTAPNVAAADAPSPIPTPGPEARVEVEPIRDVAAAVTDPPQPAPEAAAFREIVVPRGTSLSALTHQYYGEGSSKVIDRIRALNPQIVNVNQIFAGDRLRLPALADVDSVHE
jgi:hypothetical protein